MEEDRPFREYRIAIMEHIKTMKEVTDSFREKLEEYGKDQVRLEGTINHLDGAVTNLENSFKKFQTETSKEIYTLNQTKARLYGLATGISLAVSVLAWIVMAIIKTH